MEMQYTEPAKSFRSQTGRFLLHFLELQLPMSLGALVCYLLSRLVPASSSFAAIYHPGTYLFAAGDIFYLSFPVLIWMIFRGHGWLRSFALVFAMIAPVAAIAVAGELTGSAYLLWLVTGMYPAMCLGMLACMLYRRDYFTRIVKRHDYRYSRA
jgi:hypothetical protein